MCELKSSTARYDEIGNLSMQVKGAGRHTPTMKNYVVIAEYLHGMIIPSKLSCLDNKFKIVTFNE